MAVSVKGYKTTLISQAGNDMPWHIVIIQGDQPDLTGYGSGTVHSAEEILQFWESYGVPRNLIYVDTDAVSVQDWPLYDLAGQDYSNITGAYTPTLKQAMAIGDRMEVVPIQKFSPTAVQNIGVNIRTYPNSGDGRKYATYQVIRNTGDPSGTAWVRDAVSGNVNRYVMSKIIWVDDFSNFDPENPSYPNTTTYTFNHSRTSSSERDTYEITSSTGNAGWLTGTQGTGNPVAAWVYAHILAGDLESYEWEGESEDPYAVDGYSEQQGGTGTASWEGDTIGIPALPSLSAVDTGFISLYNPSAAQVQALASYMWSQNFDLSIFKNVVANPIDCILGLAIFPIDPQNGTAKTIKVGNIPTDVSMPPVISQWQEKDCGTLDVREYWGSYLDYSPYTKMSLYLPYVGIVPLDVDDVMNGPIRVVYHIDMLSGACVAYVLCHGTQLYTYNGQCSCNVPITSNDFTNTVNGILGIAGNVGSLIATGGASAPSAVPGLVSNAVNALKPNIQKSGALSGTGGLMGVQTPYLIMQRPKQSLARTHAATKGYPANISVVLGNVSGYAEIDAIDLEGVPCTQAEAEEIEQLLKAGVFL